MTKFIPGLIFILIIISIIITFILIPTIVVKKPPVEYENVSMSALSNDISGTPHEVIISVVENSNPKALIPFYLSTNDSSVGKYFINCNSRNNIQVLSSVPVLINPSVGSTECNIVRYFD